MFAVAAAAAAAVVGWLAGCSAAGFLVLFLLLLEVLDEQGVSFRGAEEGRGLITND